MIKRKIAAILASIFVISAGASVYAEYSYSDELDVAQQVAGYISTYYIDDSLKDEDIIMRALSEYLKEDDEKLVEFLKSMLESLDPYSQYFTAEEYKGFINNVNKTFYGIGVRIEQKEGYVEVTGFTSGSPAEAAGIKTGDKISRVNGENMYGKNVNDVRNAIAGELGASVEVSVLRDSAEYTFTVVRGEVNEDTVSYGKISDSVAYISVIDMSDNTTEEFIEALAQADADGITNIILDLRNNVGGYLSCAVNMGRLVVPKGVIVSTKYRQPFMDQTYHSDLKETKYKFNVLVNEYTASAAEIFASALQDSGAGYLIGEKTYGKGVIQNMFPLSNGSVFKLTVGHYETRNGQNIDKVGITPNEIVLNEAALINTSTYNAFTFSRKWHEGSTGEDIKAAKQRLYYLGYYNGEVNDVFDSLLTEAVKNFQLEDNLYPYGVLDITTQTRLDTAFSKIEVFEDKQLERAYELFTGEKLPE